MTKVADPREVVPIPLQAQLVSHLVGLLVGAHSQARSQ